MLLAVAVDVSQEAEQRVVIGLRNGVELVVVATGASDAQPEEGGARRAQHVVEVVEFRRGGVIRLIVPDVQSVEASSDETGSPFRCEGRFGLEGRFGQFVTRELFSHELIVGLVAVEAVDDVVAVTPGVRLRSVALVPVALGIADQIQPMSSPTLAIMRGLEQAIDEGDPGGVRGVTLKLGHRFW